jgi:prefoldin subunit 5
MQINPELNDLRSRLHLLENELTALKTKLEQVEQADRKAGRTNFLQMIGVVATATALVIATLLPRFEAINQRFDSVNQRFDSLEKRIEQSEKSMNQRFDDFQKAQDKRFDDFKQEMRSLLKK